MSTSDFRKNVFRNLLLNFRTEIRKHIWTKKFSKRSEIFILSTYYRQHFLIQSAIKSSIIKTLRKNKPKNGSHQPEIFSRVRNQRVDQRVKENSFHIFLINYLINYIWLYNYSTLFRGYLAEANQDRLISQKNLITNKLLVKN